MEVRTSITITIRITMTTLTTTIDMMRPIMTSSTNTTQTRTTTVIITPATSIMATTNRSRRNSSLQRSVTRRHQQTATWARAALLPWLCPWRPWATEPVMVPLLMVVGHHDHPTRRQHQQQPHISRSFKLEVVILLSF